MKRDLMFTRTCRTKPSASKHEPTTRPIYPDRLRSAGLIQPPLLAQSPVSGQAAQQSRKSPVKGFILAGQSNREGQAVADLGGKDYFLVREGLGEAMAELLAATQGKAGPEPSKPASHAIRNIEGWTVRVDDRLPAAPNEALGARALRFLEYKLADIRAVVAAEPEIYERMQAIWGAGSSR